MFMHLTDGQYGLRLNKYLDDVGTGVDFGFIMQTITQKFHTFKLLEKVFAAGDGWLWCLSFTALSADFGWRW